MKRTAGRFPGSSGAAVAALLLLVMLPVVAISTRGAATSRTVNSAGTVWLTSFDQGALVQVNGATGDVVSTTRVFDGGQRFTAVQQGPNGLAVQGASVVRVSGATFEASQPLTVTSDGRPIDRALADDELAYAFSGPELRVLDPTSMHTVAVHPLPGPVDDAIRGVDGSVWMLDARAGTVTEVHGPRLGSVHHVGPVGTGAQLVGGATRPSVLSVDPLGLVSIDGGSPRCGTVLPSGDSYRADRASAGPTVLATRAGRLVRAEPGGDLCRAVDLPGTNGHDLGAPVSTDHFSFVPDYTDGSVLRVDWDNAQPQVAPLRDLVEPGHSFELFANDSFVFFNDPTSARAGILYPDQLQITKTSTAPGDSASVAGRGRSGDPTTRAAAPEEPQPADVPPEAATPPETREAVVTPMSGPVIPGGERSGGAAAGVAGGGTTRGGRGEGGGGAGGGRTDASAAFDLVASTVAVGEELTVIDRSVPAPDKVSWDWGDGHDEDAQPSGIAHHRYERAGTFVVRLVAHWSSTTDTVVRTVTVTSTPKVPGAFNVLRSLPQEMRVGDRATIEVLAVQGGAVTMKTTAPKVCTSDAPKITGTKTEVAVSTVRPGQCTIVIEQEETEKTTAAASVSLDTTVTDPHAQFEIDGKPVSSLDMSICDKRTIVWASDDFSKGDVDLRVTFDGGQPRKAEPGEGIDLTFDGQGAHEVVATATHAGGFQLVTSLDVNVVLPTLQLSGPAQAPNAGDPVSLQLERDPTTCRLDTPIVVDFGDGSTASMRWDGTPPSHTYTTAGTRTIRASFEPPGQKAVSSSTTVQVGDDSTPVVDVVSVTFDGANKKITVTYKADDPESLIAHVDIWGEIRAGCRSNEPQTGPITGKGPGLQGASLNAHDYNPPVSAPTETYTDTFFPGDCGEGTTLYAVATIRATAKNGVGGKSESESKSYSL